MLERNIINFSDGPWLNVTTPQTELYLQGLMKYTNYTIKVAGFSNYGLGPFSYPVVCTTLQDGNYLHYIMLKKIY